MTKLLCWFFIGLAQINFIFAGVCGGFGVLCMKLANDFIELGLGACRMADKFNDQTP